MGRKAKGKSATPKGPARRVANRQTREEYDRQEAAGEWLDGHSVGWHDFIRGTTDMDAEAAQQGTKPPRLDSPRPRRGPDGRLVNPFEVLIDTREQQPYSFLGITADAEYGGTVMEVPVRRTALKYGDYSVFGLPQVAVERKSKADLYSSIAQRRDNFQDRLEAMQVALAWAAVVVECSWREAVTDPPPHTEYNPKSLYRTIDAWSQRYPCVHWVWCDDREEAELRTFRLLERFWRDHREWAAGTAPTNEGMVASG